MNGIPARRIAVEGLGPAVLSLVMIAGLGGLAQTSFAAPQEARTSSEGDAKASKSHQSEDRFDAAGGATAGALSTAGDATSTGLSAAGKGTGAAVEHTGRSAVTAAKVTGNTMKKTGSAIAGVFGGGKSDDSGEIDVRAAQKALQGIGYYGGPIDGIAGPKTESGLREFQHDENLNVTGKLDAPTAKRLGI